ncbi:MAG TPA: hypothetical protein VNY36_02165, partial [Bacteroidia bacterium]|nr:hypothetical protein [Bacteroidia bacterium]
MASTPVGSVVSMQSPINSTGTGLSISSTTNILQANGTLFNNLWKIPNTSVVQPVCTTSTTRADTCLAQFLDSIIIHKQLFAKPSDSIHFGKYVKNPSCHSDSAELYYALGETRGENDLAVFQAQLGNCMLTISSTSGAAGNIYTLSPYYQATCDGPRTVSISESGCLNMYVPSSDNPFLCSSPHVLAATACISCISCHDSCENIATNSTINPYAVGMLGNWRPERNYVYYDTRSPALASTTSDIWKTGIYNHFNPIWKLSSGVWAPDTTDDKNWTWASRNTMFDAKGNEIEEQNALGIYSSALFGYVKSVPVAEAANARFKEIAFDGFEDYGFTNSCNSACDNSHFSFINYISDTTSTQSHTGKYSLKLSSGSNAYVTRSVNYYNGAIDSTTHSKFYMLNGGTVPLFSPDSGTYLLSAWVKENTTCGVTGYAKDSIVVSYTPSSSVYSMKPSGPVIEGWQRIECRFKVPGKATAITVKLVAGTNTAYYDDIRIEPFAAEMQTFVYDPSSLRLSATLDENNYATLYEYNDEGILMRVKKETERGIKTIKESRSSYHRK